MKATLFFGTEATIKEDSLDEDIICRVSNRVGKVEISLHRCYVIVKWYFD